MICLYKDSQLIPLKGYRDFHITHAQDGFDEMSFRFPMGLEQYPLLTEEAELYTDSNVWTIKKISNDVIDCQINLDFLKGSFFREYSSGSLMLASLLASIFVDWTIEGAGVSTILRTINMENVTLKDVVLQAESTYNVRFGFDARHKVVTVTDVTGLLPSAEYITDQLNLKTLSYRGETTDFVTRLYVYGQDGLTVEEAVVNGETYGLPYIDNFSYSDKVICGYWEDDRYTDANNLYSAGVSRLADLAIPKQSYECNVIDLAKLDDRWNFLEFAMHRKITLIDSQRGLRVVHQVVEYDEYPDEPVRNVVTLATTPQTVTSYVEGSVGGVVEMLNNAEVYINENKEITKELTETITSLQSTITSNQGEIAQINQALTEISATVGNLQESLQTTITASEQRWDWVQNNQATFSEYIRFYRGSIVLGSSQSPIKIRIENNGDIKRIIFFSGEDFSDNDISIFCNIDANEIYDNLVRALSSLYVGQKTGTNYAIENDSSDAFVIRRI